MGEGGRGGRFCLTFDLSFRIEGDEDDEMETRINPLQTKGVIHLRYFSIFIHRKGHLHCHRHKAEEQASHPVSTSSSLCVHHNSVPGGTHRNACIDLRKQDLGVFILQKRRINALLKAKSIHSLYFSRISPSFKNLRFKNHSIPGWTVHGFARSCCRASRCFASWREMVSSGTHTWSSRASSQTQLGSELLHPVSLHVIFDLCKSQPLCRSTCLPRAWILPNFCPSLQWHRRCLPLFGLHCPRSTKGQPELLQHELLMNLALALSWVLGHVRPVLPSKRVFFAFHASALKRAMLYACPPATGRQKQLPKHIDFT